MKDNQAGANRLRGVDAEVPERRDGGGDLDLFPQRTCRTSIPNGVPSCR